MKIALLIIAAMPIAVHGEPLSLKGIAPGMSKAAMIASHPGLGANCSPTTSRGAYDEACGYITKYHKGSPNLDTFAGVAVSQWTVFLADGMVKSIMVSVPSSRFGEVEAALVERYGKPSGRTTGEVKNRMGASFDQTETRWTIGDDLLQARKRGAKVDTASIFLTNKTAVMDSESGRADAAKKGAQDL